MSYFHCVLKFKNYAQIPVANAAAEALSSSGNLGYTDAFGLLPLREKIAQHYKKKYNLERDIDPKRIVVSYMMD